MSDIDEIKEELFCINFEAKSFAAYMVNGKIERWLPDFTENSTEDSHLKRYILAQNYVKGKKVLDMACGSGRGSYLLAKDGGAVSVMGLDLDKDAIRYASHRNKHENVSYTCGDATSFCREGHFDTVVSFETVEHLPEIDSYLSNINKSLARDGSFLVSTPISKFDLDSNPANIFHVREWGIDSFQREINRYFSIAEVYFQMYPYLSTNRFSSITKKINSLIFNNRKDTPFLSTIYKEGQLPKHIKSNMMGRQYRGYQILVCKKK